MNVTGLDGKQHKGWPPVGHTAESHGSAPHKQARALLKELFPLHQRLEEVPIPGSRMRADFYLPSKKLLVEVQGNQHYELVPFFHGQIDGFLRSNQRDSKKKEFCKLNGLTYVELSSDEPERWRGLLEGANRGT